MTFDLIRNVSSFFIYEDNFQQQILDFDSLCRAGMDFYIGYEVLDDDVVKFTFDGEKTSRKENEFDEILQNFFSSSLQKEKRIVWDKINQFRDKWQYDFFVYDGRQWDCDPASRAIIIGTVTFSLALGGNLPPGFVYRDHNNNNWPMTGKQIIELGATLFEFTGHCYQVSWLHKYCLGLCTTVEDINNYNYTIGWPSRDI